MPGWPIPSEFPLNKLVGQEVTQICIGIGQVQLNLYWQPQPGTPDHWEPGARIDIESAFTLAEDGANSTMVEPDSFKSKGALLANLLGETISEVCREPRNELRLVFSKGLSLRMHTDPQGFESYHLHIAGESVTITGAQGAG